MNQKGRETSGDSLRKLDLWGLRHGPGNGKFAGVPCQGNIGKIQDYFPTSILHDLARIIRPAISANSRTTPRLPSPGLPIYFFCGGGCGVFGKITVVVGLITLRSKIEFCKFGNAGIGRRNDMPVKFNFCKGDVKNELAPDCGAVVLPF